MPQVILGDFQVKRTLNVDRRLNQGLSKETITSLRSITLNDYAWLQIINASTQDVVLPDATTLSNGWDIVVMADALSGASVNVKKYDAATPVLLKNILVGRAYQMTLVDNSTPAGDWQISFREESDKIPSARYVDSFNDTTDWTGPAAGYYTRTVTQVTHTLGTSPLAKVRSGSGPYVNVEPDQLSVGINGDITIQVTQVPDLRFVGQMVIV